MRYCGECAVKKGWPLDLQDKSKCEICGTEDFCCNISDEWLKNYGKDAKWKKPKKGYWCTRQGEMIKLTDMEDRHLLSVIAFYRRRAIERVAVTTVRTALMDPSMMSEAAQDGAEEFIRQSSGEVMDQEALDEELWVLIAEESPKWHELIREASRRNLDYGFIGDREQNRRLQSQYEMSILKAAQKAGETCVKKY